MAGGIDYAGIAAVIAAIGIAVPSVIAAINSRTALKRGIEQDRKLSQIADGGIERDKKLVQIANGVDGLSDKRAATAHEAGVREGGDAERANPTDPR